MGRICCDSPGAAAATRTPPLSANHTAGRNHDAPQCEQMREQAAVLGQQGKGPNPAVGVTHGKKQTPCRNNRTHSHQVLHLCQRHNVLPQYLFGNGQSLAVRQRAQSGHEVVGDVVGAGHGLADRSEVQRENT